MERLWTISELSSRVRAALASGYEAPENGQVRAVPSERTIRYYTTIGLLSRPAAMRGRTALYDSRHLAEIVAIKRLQASGLPLADVQTRLAGATAAEIADLAALDKPTDAAPTVSDAEPDTTTPFWLEAPATSTSASPPKPSPPASPSSPPRAEPPAKPATPTTPTDSARKPAAAAKPTAATPTAAAATPTPAAAAEQAPAATLIGFQLAPGITLLLDTREHTPPDLATLRRAAATLLAAIDTSPDQPT